MQHILQTLRIYLNLTQAKLAKAANVMPADISEMENKPPYGQIHKYQRVASYLSVPVDILIRNSYPCMPESFTSPCPRRRRRFWVAGARSSFSVGSGNGSRLAGLGSLSSSCPFLR